MMIDDIEEIQSFFQPVISFRDISRNDLTSVPDRFLANNTKLQLVYAPSLSFLSLIDVMSEGHRPDSYNLSLLAS
jgi:hypothetical protein